MPMSMLAMLSPAPLSLCQLPRLEVCQVTPTGLTWQPHGKVISEETEGQPAFSCDEIHACYACTRSALSLTTTLS